jgi:lysozyme
MVNENGKNPKIKDQFLRWNKAGGKVVRGLTLRRNEEAFIYFS